MAKYYVYDPLHEVTVFWSKANALEWIEILKFDYEIDRKDIWMEEN